MIKFTSNQIENSKRQLEEIVVVHIDRIDFSLLDSINLALKDEKQIIPLIENHYNSDLSSLGFKLPVNIYIETR